MFSIFSGSNSTITANYTPSYPKVVITVCIALFAVILAVVIAKLANVCHDKAVIEDDSSDISDNTKQIIKARLSLILLQRKSRNGGMGQRFFRLWSRKANDTLTRDSSFSSEKSSGTVINVEEAGSIEVKNKSSTAKLNVLLSNKVAQEPDELKINSENVQSKKKKNIEKPTPSSSKNTLSSPKRTNSRTPSPTTQNKTATSRPPSARRQDSFIGPNVSRSDTLKTASPPGKRRDVTSATAVSISVSINGNNKTKKSVTFEDQVKINIDNPTNPKDTNSSNKSNLKKT